jgi:diguanylate cyclase (GGDEF)-like protein
MWNDINERGYWQGEVWNRRKNGDTYPQLLTISTVYDEQQVPVRYIGVFSDITSIKENQAQLEYMAQHDPLTQLPNRALIELLLQQAVEQAHRHGQMLAVLFIDLDHFKPVNDSFGHLVGDELLCAVTKRLGSRLREGDTLGRLGGDEFILLLTMLSSPQDAAVVARDFITALSEPFRLSGNLEIFIGGSIGISLFPQNGMTVSELMMNADAAMYLAKENGRNQFSFYTPELNADARNKLALENELRRAILQHELTLHYQPKVDLLSGNIVGAEALCRWQLADGSWIPPDQFIPIAEKSGLILELGAWVIEQSCKQVRAWLDDGLREFCIAINVSARQFRSGDLDKQLADAIERHGIDARHLEIELTESMLMQEPQRAIESMHKLKQLGVKISLDDFGTGYSSLGYLSRFPIDTLKIDQSFVRGVTTEPDDAEIASAIIGLAHRLKLRVVAEGAETLEQLVFMRSNECNELQGYYFSKPLAADDFAAMVQSGKMLDH